ncbi:MAG: AEC family transporter [Phycisphaerae bacterium]|nr:AEC family transporter [Phycisphaerae bacterium]
MAIFNTIIPVFVVIGLGFVLTRRGFFSGEFATGLNKLVYWVGLPCLLFYNVAVSEFDYDIAGRTFLGVLGGAAASLVVGYLFVFFSGMKFEGAGTFAQGTFRGNLMYIGLPVLAYSLGGGQGVLDARTGMIVAFVFALTVPIYNVVSVFALLLSRHSFNRGAVKRMFIELLRNPLIIACVLGVVWGYLFGAMPAAMSRSLEAIGQMALPLALLCIGAILAAEHIGGQIFYSVVSSIIKVGVCPLAAYAAGRWVGLGVDEMRIVMVFSACPTAVASSVLVDQIGGDRRMSAGIVVISTLMSIISLSVVVSIY